MKNENKMAGDEDGNMAAMPSEQVQMDDDEEEEQFTEQGII